MTEENAHRSAHQLARALELAAGAESAVLRGEPADAFLAAAFRSHREFGARDRRFYGNAVFSLFRWRGAVDHAGIQDPATRLLVAWLLDDMPAPPALQAFASSVNGLEALLARARSAPPACLVPAWLPRALPADCSTHALIRSLQVRPPTWLRCRTGAREAVCDACRRAGANPVAHTRMPQAVALDRNVPLEALHRETEGGFEVQDIASQSVGLVCAPLPGESWWDVCAGGGGKSLHLADLLQNRGRILATDVREAALRETMRRARSAGVRIISTARADEAPSETAFDGVLVDAPCSGIGTWSRNPDMRWRTPESWIAEKAGVQRELLARSARAVRPGGRLVYAVCTMTRAESVDVIANFLRLHPDFVPQAFVHPMSGAAQAGSAQIWPAEGPGDGMFIACLRRAAG